MATTMADVREGIRANLAATYTDIQVSAYALEAPITPTLQVKGPEDIEYNEAMGRGMGIWTLIVQGFSGTAFSQGAQNLLDQWISVNGVKAAIESDRTLGGKVHDCVVDRCRHYGPFHLPSGMTFQGAEWTVTVLVPGS
jgi:hypothetical protein